ncbi:uncharacterized protein V2V93DRAFT_39674 [Kockiozyma suomiensis]|uniref:uncharacterized protein n=1 Tax=Kockiozyma suomiensis TaxID=1337062 RepID=UPI003344372B
MGDITSSTVCTPFTFRKASDLKANASLGAVTVVTTKIDALSTPVKGSGGRQKKDKKISDTGKLLNSNSARKPSSQKQPQLLHHQQQQHQQPQPQPQQQHAAVAISTPVRATGDAADRYAGPTFHSSPAPNAIPVPKFLSNSVPTGSSVDQFFTSVASETGSSSSAVSVSSPSLSPSTTSSPSILSAVPTFEMEESILVTQESEAQSAPPSPSPATATKGPAARSSRFGDNVVFKPRRKQATSTVSQAQENEPIKNVTSQSPGRHAPADFNFLFKQKPQATAAAASSSGERRAPQEFEFLFKSGAAKPITTV